MSRHAARVRSGKDRTSLYQEITDKIIAELESGRVPWVQPWGTVAAKATLTMPKNASTQRQYSGINVLILWGAVIQHGFSTQNWLTFRQALGLGGSVRKGEHGTTVVYADRFVPDEERQRAERDGDEPNAIPFLKHFTVFNTDQCEHLPPELTSAPAPVPEGLILPHAEALIAATGADFRVGGDRAFYSTVHDFIQVPRPEAYFEPINWHRTAVHELGHWSGHPSRLGRDLSGNFGSTLYAKEELVAEMTSAFVCASLGIVPTVRHADYIGSWLEVLRDDDRAIVRAASAASKAADYLLAFRPSAEEPVEVPRVTDHLDGRTVLQLQDGLELRRVKVMGEFRLKLCGFTDGAVERLKATGLISEIISWKLRLFVPTGAAGPTILAHLMERHPLIRVADKAAA